MKILCVSDHIDPLVYSSAIKERFADIDIILCAGDLPMEYIDFIVSSLNKPAYFIFGNHNLNEFEFYHKTRISVWKHHEEWNMSFFHGASYAGFKVFRENGLLLAGTSGSMKYNRELDQYTDFQMSVKLWKMIPALLWNKIRYGRFLDILLTHAPPAGIHDKQDLCHRGFKCYLWFMKFFKPKYLIHGHIHLYDMHEQRISRYYQTTVINAYSQYILEL